MNYYVKKRCVTCNGTGTMEIINTRILRREKMEYVNSVKSTDTAEEVLKAVRYILGTHGGEDILDRAKEIVKRAGKKNVRNLKI